MPVNASSTQRTPHACTAVFVQVAALMLAVLSLVGAALTEDKERRAFVGVGISSAIVFALWSALLAARAIYWEEPSRWPRRILALVLLEANVSSVWYWIVELKSWNHVAQVSYLTLLGPLFIVMFTAAGLAGLVFALWRVRRFAYRNPQCTRRARWKFGLRRFEIVTALLFLLATPYPLYLYGVFRMAEASGPDWPEMNAAAMPGVVSDPMVWVLEKIEDKYLYKVDDMILSRGYVSHAALLQNIYRDNHAAVALRGLESRDPKAALDCALEIPNKYTSARSTLAAFELLGVASEIVAQLGSADQIRQFLKPASALCRYTIIRSLPPQKIREHIPELKAILYESFSDPNNSEHGAVFFRLAEVLPYDEVGECFKKSRVRDGHSIATISNIKNDNNRIMVLCECLELERDQADWNVLNHLSHERLQTVDEPVRAHCILTIFRFLSHPQFSERCAAAITLWQLLDLPISKELHTQLVGGVGSSEEREQPTPAEREIERIKKLTQEWLDSHKSANGK